MFRCGGYKAAICSKISSYKGDRKVSRWMKRKRIEVTLNAGSLSLPLLPSRIGRGKTMI